ncbi:putative dolichyl pyrophosphate Glc1Man9GlcNAc2 alpha-1,3-glucosyltransferase [Rhizoctonia solani]|uniref:Putative dolichyl pyrophosphate Glc1Man9GlcNAc2 alpha-1,3-glucosyltransferase n=1 Tax=Rhizoctonia solani TaxID=456999 RepID=A0A0K6GIW0_9AGAM|nr:putative dolichyl pyrophosphate Glc1Man9GlcNAc2 alpha-1,3-glucosyltransferase [Rhizoctonia solani]
MSFVDSIILSAPQGSNPYAYAAQFVATVIPPKPGWYFANIIASGIVAAINLISTIACFIVMWKRSRAGTGVGLWFFRLRYGHASGVPYIMPNALTMFLFWNLIFMLLMQPYIWLNYFAYHTPSLQLTSRMYFWYGFVFIWDATGMWTSAFGTLYTTLLPKLFTVTPSDNGPIRRFLLHPITLNLLCFGPPSGLALTQFITSTYSAIGWSNLVHTQFALIDILNALAAEWAQSVAHTVEDALYQQASDLGTLFLVQKDISQHAFQKNAWTCGAWYLLCIVLFTPTAVWLLWVIRGTMKQRTRRVTPHAPAPTAANGAAHPTAFGHAQPRSSFAPFTRGHPGNANTPYTPYTPSHTPGAGVNWTVNSQAGQVPQDDSIKQLRRALLTASLQFSATFFCLGMAAGSWLWIAADAGRLIVNPTLHALAILLTIWVYVVVGCLVNLFILIRTRRPDDSSASGNSLPLSAIKASHASSSQSHSRAEPERKRVYIMAHTTTHVVVDDTGHRSSGSDQIHAADVTLGVKQPYDAQGDLESTYSLNSAHGDPTKSKPLDGLE